MSFGTVIIVQDIHTNYLTKQLTELKFYTYFYPDPMIAIDCVANTAFDQQ